MFTLAGRHTFLVCQLIMRVAGCFIVASLTFEAQRENVLKRSL